MSLYARGDERAIRAQRLVEDWTKSGLLTTEQRARLVPELQVDLRRTNRFLRATLFVFGYVIVQSVLGLFAILLDLGDATGPFAIAMAAVFYALAQLLVTRYKLYRFGIEEAAAIASITAVVVGAAIIGNDRPAMLLACSAGAAGSYFVCRRFGFVYAGVAAVVFAGLLPFTQQTILADTPRRMIAMVILLVICGLARERRKDHEWEYPGDLYAVLETTAWVGFYLLVNLRISEWLSVPDGYSQVYWATYAAIWILPAIGLFLAVRDRHRLMLDANIVLALLTLLTNKPYLGAPQNTWDPIVFGVATIAIALGLKRWLSSGADESRSGFIATRLLASERDRLNAAGTAASLIPGAPAASPSRAHEPSTGFGGGESGGAGATGKF